jgi:hypothetical protein
VIDFSHPFLSLIRINAHIQINIMPLSKAEQQTWLAAWQREIKDLSTLTHAHYSVGATRLRCMLRSGLLSNTDIADDPWKFFSAHHEMKTVVGCVGYFVRFTVRSAAND